jgi:monoterpene epsilon-lactone hydrolase
MRPYPTEAKTSKALPNERMAWNVRLSNTGYGWMMNALFHPSFSPKRMRRNFEFFAGTPLAKLKRQFSGTEFQPLTLGSLRAESIIAVPNPTRTILYLHGGGYVFGSIATYRRRAIKLSYRCKAEVIMPEYRLAPEHPYPAALEDAMTAWHYMARENRGGALLVAGDSAGGGLALALTALLRDRSEPLPAGVIALSPWTDLAMTGQSMLSNRARDCWLKREQLQEWSDHYCGRYDAKLSYISPLYADLSGFPPLLALAGDQELLLDDTRRLVQNAQRCGVWVREEIGRGMQHDWPLTLPWLIESARAWKVIASFVAEISGNNSPTSDQSSINRPVTSA